jgi:hypothetical protein
LQGREADSLGDLNNQLRQWVWEVANQRVHGTTHEMVMPRWDADQMALHALDGRTAYPFADEHGMAKWRRQPWRQNTLPIPELRCPATNT